MHTVRCPTWSHAAPSHTALRAAAPSPRSVCASISDATNTYAKCTHNAAHPAGTYFEVAANAGFQVTCDEHAAYLCEYL